MSQEILFCYRAIEGEYKQHLPKIRELINQTYPEPHYKIKPFLVNSNNMKELVRQQDLSYFNPPIAAFYNSTDYGRLDDSKNWDPLIEKCKQVIFLHVFDTQSPSFEGTTKAVKLHWDTAYKERFPSREYKLIHLDKDKISFTPEQLVLLQATNSAERQSTCRLS